MEKKAYLKGDFTKSPQNTSLGKDNTRGKAGSRLDADPYSPAGKVDYKVSDEEASKLTPLLTLGIVFFPYIFSWFTLRKGYSTLSRVLSFIWFTFCIIYIISDAG